jgi:hypothetical protein
VRESNHCISLIDCLLTQVNLFTIRFVTIVIYIKRERKKEAMPSSELYVGNLDADTRSQEVREMFEQYGTINRCEVKVGGSGKIKLLILLLIIMKYFFSLFCSIRFCWI